MSKRRGRGFFRDDKGATMVEFTLVAPLLFFLTFGIAELGYYFFQAQALNRATSAGVRMAATRGPVITGVGDCGPGVTGTAGTYCRSIAASRTWAPLTCVGSATAPTPATTGTTCNATAMGRILQEMRLYYPQLTIANLRVTYSPSALGFMGLGRPVPIVTVTVTGVNANLNVLRAFGVRNITMPPLTSTLTAEDMSG